mgnify:CR=1 FL=1
MNNLKKPTQAITNVLFLNSKTFFENGGCKITLVNKFKNYSASKGSFIDPITRKAIAYDQSFRVYDEIPQKICSISFTSISSFIEILKVAPLGFPIVGFKMGAKQSDSRFYECVEQKHTAKKKGEIEMAIYDYLAKDFKKFWGDLCKEYKSNQNLLALDKLELPMYEEKGKKEKKKEEDNIMFVSEFSQLRVVDMREYASQFGVTGRSKQGLIDALKAKKGLK